MVGLLVSQLNSFWNGVWSESILLAGNGIQHSKGRKFYCRLTVMVARQWFSFNHYFFDRRN